MGLTGRIAAERAAVTAASCAAWRLAKSGTVRPCSDPDREGAADGSAFTEPRVLAGALAGARTVKLNSTGVVIFEFAGRATVFLGQGYVRGAP
jgi:hypothetical protein